MITLATGVESVPRISKKILPALKQLGIVTIRDLLFHFPSRHEEFPAEQAIADVAVGERATIMGIIQKIAERRTIRGLRMAEARVADASGAINVVWFNHPFLAQTLKEGDSLRLSGKVARGARGISLQNPSYEKIPRAPMRIEMRGIHTGGLVPVYPETAGITSRWLRFLMKTYLPLAAALADPLPPETRGRHNLIEINTALRQIHFPESQNQATDAERRFIFEELLLIQLRALRERSRMKQRAAHAIPFDIELVKSFVSSLPFKLTDAQRRAIWEIGRDLSKPQPMNRLLEGDVGSGKTVVAAAAALLAVRAGYRVAHMAPTEILARQHFATFAGILAPFHITIGLRTASEKKPSAAADILIGTHALLHQKAAMENLGLVIIDEQHRFGVHQRHALVRGTAQTERGRTQTTARDEFPRESAQEVRIPHFLSMTATPIPRTLALTIYGDLDISLLDEMPANRKPVITRVVPASKRAEAYRFIRDEVLTGRQVFVICPRIDTPQINADSTRTDAEKSQRKSAYRPRASALWAEVKTVTDEYKKLSEFIFPDLRIAMLHGRMKPKEKTAAMRQFSERGADILVSTSVIEVGVDIPNAAIMMIEGAERFGLAQLHQFRGRVGRGAEQSYCFLFSTEDGPVSKRLRAVVDAKNGFELAEKDLAIRGPGDLFGDRQWGEPGLVLKGITDARIVRAAREEAVALATQSPDLAQYPALAIRLEALEKTLHLE